MYDHPFFKLHSAPNGIKAGALLVNSPHSGRDYSMVDLSVLKCSSESLYTLEDTMMDEIAQLAELPQYGITSLEALFPRSYIDPNRSITSLDKTQIRDWTGKHFDFFVPDFYTALGCGLVPIRAAAENFELYAPEHYPTESDIAGRLRLYHAYHRQLHETLHGIFNMHGGYAMIDMHSCYPSGIVESGARENRADIILSNCHGQSCSEEFMNVVKAAYLEHGITDITINYPFRGGFITSHYGRGGRGVFSAGQPIPTIGPIGIQALQVEINKRLYWDFEKRQQKADAEALKQVNIQVFRTVNDYLVSLAPKLAA